MNGGKTWRLTAPLMAVSLITTTTVVLTSLNVAPVSAFTCSDVVLVGVRESGAAQSDWGGLGQTVDLLRQTFEEGVSGKRTVSVQALQYPATTTSAIFQDWGAGAAEFLNGVDDGVSELALVISSVLTRCNSWIAVAGYSQGALVIRKALAQLDSTAQSHIAGIALFGDPARHDSGDGLDHYGGAQGSGRNGVYESLLGTRVPPSPRGRGLAAAWCVPNDAICDFTPFNLARDKYLGGDAANHAKYKFNGMARTAGYWMADDLLKLPNRPASGCHSTSPTASSNGRCTVPV